MKSLAPFFLFLALITCAFADNGIEGKEILDVKVKLETLAKGSTFNTQSVLSKMRTRAGEKFSQQTFDRDLKELSNDYDRIDPNITTVDGKVNIELRLWRKPIITAIKWQGNKHISGSRLQRELDIQPYTVFDRAHFSQQFNKVKELYIKKGYFESHLSYKIIPDPNNNEVEILIRVEEGHSGHIHDLVFEGFSKREESQILEKINTKKYNFLMSWITGNGIYHKEALEHDKLIITNYLQNEGYADAKVDISVRENQKGNVEIVISAIKGEKYTFGRISFSGNHLLTDSEVSNALIIHQGDHYSPEILRDAQENLQHLYGKDGYIDTNITYQLTLLENSPVYEVHFDIEEGNQYKVGLIRILGNESTNKNVILRESLLTPGEVFDSRRLKATQDRLMAVGYFKSVNVYSVPTEDPSLGPDYRDVVIEVDETSTGSLSFFVGASSIDSVFGGLDLAENNFNYRGLGRLWKDGLSAVRGGGEYASIKVSVGQRQQEYDISWMTPYLMDTMWRLGFDVNFAISALQSKRYDVTQFGGSVFASYPFNAFWTYSMKFRGSNSIVDMSKKLGKEGQEQEKNSGLVFGYSNSLIFDSVDNPYRPHRGFKSILEGEIALIRRHSSDERVFPFAKAAYINTFYYPITHRGVLKTRYDFKFLFPIGQGDQALIPVSERYFLGGETSVRGYRSYHIGPTIQNIDVEGNTVRVPIGGISSGLLSVEYNHSIFRMLDVFTFFDAGAVSDELVKFHKFRMSYGFGGRIDIGNRVPIMVGMGFPINPKHKGDVKKFFFSMGGQF
ncbi:MAG: Outer membrane protein assembly factor BamA [Chlamydiia bacterium]|nr:Outer membrane protein assembly factor BamA [Chlamydiia bacterium]MCH9615877.1 Outer membrane protein assembly factor BamA [Chlamydiia bacterium]MCH9628720.1 Outer membrane protein assembly factor BamA [Chlamydiia bacterium]